ncbi:MAG TPA: shikimate dehydrogenase [Clostridia bacterium]|nr:shikimate dehydrogenase [Clostridia bacterium]
MITVDTKLIALMGNPLRQSFASRMQNEAYSALGLDFEYFPLEVENDHLEDMVQAFRNLNSPGFAVTKPNKIKVIEYLDGLDEFAEKMGAVNTVVKCDGKLIGYNTDGPGFIRALTLETGCDIKASTFFCFGAGGAGRAICCALAFHGAKEIIIVDRFNGASQSLTEDINKSFAPVAVWVPFEKKEVYKKSIGECDVVMNCSGVGMYPHTDETPIDAALLHAGQIAFDATYNPLKTLYLQQAEKVGCRILNGLGMSIHQGAIQVNLWSGLPEPVEIMTESISKIVAEIQASQQ